MESIFGYLKDPGWWFSAFFIAIIASVIAGFLKDRIERHLPQLSTTFSAWRARRAEERNSLIELLSNDLALLNIAYIRAVVGLLLYLIALVLFLTAPLLDELQPHSDAVLGVDRRFLFSKVLIPFMGGLAIAQGFRAASRISLVGKAWAAFRKMNGLPKMP